MTEMVLVEYAIRHPTFRYRGAGGRRTGYSFSPSGASAGYFSVFGSSVFGGMGRK